jgi:hypothetical protein
MRAQVGRATLALVVLLAAGGCATSDEWAEWKAHNTHFASDKHIGFSWRNREGQPPRVSRSDIDVARAESWWGKAITVSPEQIFQN